MAQAIVFYISSHGFGHASRAIEVINAILARRPETRIGVRTAAPRWLFDLTVKGKVSFSTLDEVLKVALPTVVKPEAPVS